MKKLVTLMIVIMMLVAVLPATQAQDDAEPFRVAAVAPSATNDLAFSQSLYDALMAIQEEMGEENFEFTFQDGTFIVDDAAVAMREWAASGDYDLVIGHGSQYGAILEELAPEFPDVSFAWGTDNDTFGLDNVFAYGALSDQGGYLNGYAAGLLTASNVIGVIGPIEVGDAKLYVDGFVYGVEASNPDAEVSVTYIESFSDVALATEAAEAHLANGADILTGTAQMVVGPIGLVIDQGDVTWFGTQTSQLELAGESQLMVQVYDWQPILMDIISKVQAGQLGGDAYNLELVNDGLVMEINEDYFGYTDEFTYDAAVELMDELTEGIVSGEIETLPMADDMEESEEESDD